jgi:hypothetical protein
MYGVTSYNFVSGIVEVVMEVGYWIDYEQKTWLSRQKVLKCTEI